MNNSKTNRRSFIKQAACSSLFLPFVPCISSCVSAQSKSRQSIGVALVGLGYYSTDLLAPALQLTQHCHLSGIVTGSPHKIPIWQEKYGIKDKNVYDYENMQGIANNPEIDVIYIVLPTGLHAEYAIKGADTGKHVWCEKPMARTVQECQDIINACNKNKVKLSIGYRMQHEPNTQTIIQMADTKPFGKIENIRAEAGYYDGRTNHWKLKKSMGGGAMYDMGVYTLNGIRYATQEEPIAVTARHYTNRPELFTEVDETTEYELEFSDGKTAKGKTSFGENLNELHIQCEKGWYGLSPFQSYSGIRGTASDGRQFNLTVNNQQTKQMDDDALAILNNTEVIVPGENAMKDIQIVEAIYKAAANDNRILL